MENMPKEYEIAPNGFIRTDYCREVTHEEGQKIIDQIVLLAYPILKQKHIKELEAKRKK